MRADPPQRESHRPRETGLITRPDLLPFGDRSPSDARGTSYVPMSVNVTPTARVVPTTRLLPVAAPRAFVGRVGVVDSLDGDPGELGLEIVLVEVHASGLILDVLLYDRLVSLPSRRDEVAPGPERRKPVQMVKLISEDVSTRSLESVNDLVGSVTSIRLHKQVDMVGRNRRGVDPPIMLFGHFMEHLFQTVFDCSFEHTRLAF